MGRNISSHPSSFLFEVPLFCFTFICQCWTNVFPSKEIMDYCKIKNKPIFYYEAEKKRQKIDLRGFFICHHFRNCDVFFYFFFSKPPQTSTESIHILLTHVVCVCMSIFYVIFFFWTVANSFHLDFNKVR